jgi:paraquat-inducible protein B
MHNRRAQPQAELDQGEALELPRAKTKKGWRISPMWLAPLAALVFIAWLLYRTFIESGPAVIVRFKDGKGIEAGKTPIQYRGVKIGEVNRIHLSKDQHYVEVSARLDRSAAGVARQGTLFWIVRPEVSIAGISGLQTIVSGAFIQVEPGQGLKTNNFTGLEQEPLIPTEERPGLRLVLLTTQLRSINEGTPVFYRGVQVGQTGRNSLDEDAQTVHIEVYIHPQFMPLVRENSKFWNSGGIDVSLGLFGAHASAHDIQTLVTGGISFATPDNPGQPASNGTAFRLYEKAQDEWVTWAPALRLTPDRTNGVEQINP